MGVNRLQGTPWHAEQFHRSENDDRRYKGRCKHYSDFDNHCSRRCGKCIGSAHCMEYDAMSDEEFKAKQKQRTVKKTVKKTGEDDCYWYS